MARKVVGVGSVGTRCWIVFLRGRDDGDPLFLQIKEAQASVLEPYVGKSAYQNHGRRVVEGQRLTQAASDIFLGWDRAGDRHRRRIATSTCASSGTASCRRRSTSWSPRCSRCTARSARRRWPAPTPGPGDRDRDRRVPGRRYRVRPGDRQLRDRLRGPERPGLRSGRRGDQGRGARGGRRARCRR